MPQPQKPNRLTERNKRKRRIALAQVEQFEDTLSGHELNLARLAAIPAADRSPDHEDVVAAEQEAVATITRSIATTLDEVGKLEAAGVTD